MESNTLSKTIRKYRGEDLPEKDLRSKFTDRTCRNHGTCPWCTGNRLSRYKKYPLIIEEEDEYSEE